MRKTQKLICFSVLFLVLGALCFGVVFLVRYPVKYKNLVLSCASAQVAPELIFGVIKAESSFNERAESSAGALGLMQVKLSTANYVAELYNLPALESSEKLFDPQTNIKIGSLYLNYLFKRFNGNVKHVLVAYNAGETKTSEWVESGNFDELAYKESLNYAKKVVKYAKVYKKLF